jgi:hypothetical protein
LGVGWEGGVIREIDAATLPSRTLGDQGLENALSLGGGTIGRLGEGFELKTWTLKPGASLAFCRGLPYKNELL